jgi:glyoxylase-like metal-dependent hydrolase (beta-lactamase superfamily II)
MNAESTARLYAFHAGGDLADLAVYDPFDPNIGTKVYEPWFFYVLTHPAGNIIFDTGVHPALVDDPRSRLGSWADLFEMRMETGHDTPSQLRSIGLEPTDITKVVLSHMHFDHVSALELFRHAEIIVQRTELSFALRPAVYQAGTYLASDFAGEFEWTAIDGFLDVFGDGVAQVIPTPGHTPGHQSMLVKLGQSTLLLIADATYQIPKMRDRLLPAIVWNPDQMVSSWHLLEWLETREDAHMLCSHDLDFRSRVKLAPTEWYE